MTPKAGTSAATTGSDVTNVLERIDQLSPLPLSMDYVKLGAALRLGGLN